MIFIYIIVGILGVLFLLFFFIRLTYIPEEKALAKAKEESAKRNQSTDWDKQQLINSLKESLKEKEEEINKKNDIIDELRMKIFDIEYAKKIKPRIDVLIEKNEELTQENDELKAENFDLELKLVDKDAIINGLLEDGRKTTILGYNAADITYLLERIYTLENKDSHSDHAAISSSRREVWGELKGKRYKTLTPEQQDQIHFPVLDPACVYYLPSHSSFHSVYWCYALDNSPSPNKTTLELAIQHKLRPCSKCVDPETFEDFMIQFQL